MVHYTFLVGGHIGRKVANAKEGQDMSDGL